MAGDFFMLRDHEMFKRPSAVTQLWNLLFGRKPAEAALATTPPTVATTTIASTFITTPSIPQTTMQFTPSTSKATTEASTTTKSTTTEASTTVSRAMTSTIDSTLPPSAPSTTTTAQVTNQPGSTNATMLFTPSSTSKATTEASTTIESTTTEASTTVSRAVTSTIDSTLPLSAPSTTTTAQVTEQLDSTNASISSRKHRKKPTYHQPRSYLPIQESESLRLFTATTDPSQIYHHYDVHAHHKFMEQMASAHHRSQSMTLAMFAISMFVGFGIIVGLIFVLDHLLRRLLPKHPRRSGSYSITNNNEAIPMQNIHNNHSPLLDLESNTYESPDYGKVDPPLATLSIPPSLPPRDLPQVQTGFDNSAYG